MDDPLLVRGLEGVRNLPRDRQRLGNRNGAAADDAERSSPSTSSITSALGPTASWSILDAVDLRDVRVVQRRQRLRLAGEAGQAVGV